MKKIIVFFLVLPFMIYSQDPDSSQVKKFENFFGSDCPVDTMSLEIAENDFCVLYANEFKVCRIKKNKIIWTIDLHNFEGADYLCMIVRPSTSKRKHLAFILGYKDEKEIGRKIIKFPSGKVIGTIRSDS